MGLYDMIYFKNSKGADCDIQFKNGECIMQSFSIGDKIELPNGIYFGQEGAFVVFDRKVVAAFDDEEEFMFSKWGHILPYPDINEINPIAIVMRRIHDKNTGE